MTSVAIIPARGGSKGIKRKNLALINGKPLIAYTCEAALQSKKINRIIVSTDDLEVADFVKNMGIEIPFIRPSELANDFTPMIDVLMHALSWFDSQNYDIDDIILLQPTSPLRTSDQIDTALTIFSQKNPDTLVSIMKVPHQFNPLSVLKEESDGRMVPYLNQPVITRRQDKPVVFARNGPAILITKASLIKKGILYGDHTIGYLMDYKTSIDVDDYQDLLMAEFFLKSN